MKLIEDTIVNIQPISKDWGSAVRDYIGRLTMPYWAMGDVLDLAVQLASITCKLKFKIERKCTIVFASDHGVTAEGISKYPSEVTKQMVLNFVHGGAAINALTRKNEVDLIVVDIGVNGDFTGNYSPKLINRKIALGTENFLHKPAMTMEQAVKSVQVGIELVEENKEQYDVFSAGEMGIGNTTASAAILSKMLNVSVDMAVGLGTGIDESTRQHKIRVVEHALEKHKKNLSSPLKILSQVGGFEIGAIAGMILGCARHKKPFVLDGFIASVGALIADQLCDYAKNYIIAGHLSQEKAHGLILNHLKKKPLLNLNMRLGEGTGAVMAMPILDAASALINDMATFEDAGVSTSKEV